MPNWRQVFVGNRDLVGQTRFEDSELKGNQDEHHSFIVGKMFVFFSPFRWEYTVIIPTDYIIFFRGVVQPTTTISLDYP